MKMHCWKCKKDMQKVKDKFHGFEIAAWKCPKCKEIIYDDKEIQPILKYNKLKEKQKELTVTVGVLGESKILRVPKIAEQLYGIHKGDKLIFDLEPGAISLRLKN